MPRVINWSLVNGRVGVNYEVGLECGEGWHLTLHLTLTDGPPPPPPLALALPSIHPSSLTPTSPLSSFSLSFTRFIVNFFYCIFIGVFNLHSLIFLFLIDNAFPNFFCVNFFSLIVLFFYIAKFEGISSSLQVT